jgi:hypothetical protein
MVLSWIAEGLETDEINQRAATQDNPFTIGRTAVAHYRKSRAVKIEEIRNTRELKALTQGLAAKSTRVEQLKEMADLLRGELKSGRMWVTDVKGIGKGADFERVEVERFNSAEVEQWRGLLDDIAREVGDRKTQVDLDTGTLLIWDDRTPEQK